MNDHIERTKRMIEVMQAYVDGEEIEVSLDKTLGWIPLKMGSWNSNWQYRIAKTPDTINWDHVAPEFKYMARDKEGFGYLYVNKPFPRDDVWTADDGKLTKQENYASYRKGNVDWNESLVIRPGFE